MQQKQQFSGWRSCTTTYSIRDITLWDTPHTPTHSVTDDLISDVLAVDQCLIDIHQQDMTAAFVPIWSWLVVLQLTELK